MLRNLTSMDDCSTDYLNELAEQFSKFLENKTLNPKTVWFYHRLRIINKELLFRKNTN